MGSDVNMETALARDLYNLGMQQTKAQDHPEDGKFVILPGNDHTPARVERIVDTTKLPTYVKARREFDDVASFAKYMERFKKPETVMIGDRDLSNITALIDYHENSETPGRTAHKAIIQLRRTPSWKVWDAINNKPLKQREFAEFVEENIEDIREPDGASVLEMASSLQTTNKVTFKSVKRLHDGTSQFTFNSETQGDSNTVVPKELTLGLRVYEGQPEGYRVTMFLRYRATEDGLTFTVKMKNREKILEEAFAQVAGEVEAVTDLPVLLGRS